MKTIAELVPLSLSDNQAIVEKALELAIDLVVVGPDDSLASGLVDLLTAKGIPCFGASQEAAKLEWSKAYSKSFMQKHGIPTAAYSECHSLEDAKDVIANSSFPLVIKASGLALGKGVIICNDAESAITALEELQLLGAAAETLIIEEFLVGRELSFFVFSDGESFVPLTPCEDYKQLLDGDLGPNTGGMGAITPLDWLSKAMYERILSEIVLPTQRGLLLDCIDYRSILYFGLMLTEAGPKVLEYNSRFGDPEAQVLLRLLKSDLVPIMLACISGELNTITVEFHSGTAVAVVLSSPGYPKSSTKGLIISGVEYLQEESNRGVVPFYSAVKLEDESFLTNGGRVLSITAHAASKELALQEAYSAIRNIDFPGLHYRKDIGRRDRLF
jgi:phosphoribosylamine--glycine ligase